MKKLIYSNEIFNLRQEHHLSQNKMAEDLGISRRSISMIENGEQNVSLEYAYRISAYFNKMVQDVFPVYKDEMNQQKSIVEHDD